MRGRGHENKVIPRKLSEVTLGAPRHGDLVVRHGHALDLLGGRVASDAIRNVLLVLAHQLVHHLLGEGAQDVLLHLYNLAVPLLVILSDVFAMAEFIGPVHLDPVPILVNGSGVLLFTCRRNSAEQIYSPSVGKPSCQSSSRLQISLTDSPEVNGW